MKHGYVASALLFGALSCLAVQAQDADSVPTIAKTTTGPRGKATPANLRIAKVPAIKASPEDDVYTADTVLHKFGAIVDDLSFAPGDSSDGLNIIQAKDGAFYGVANYGGKNSAGGIFRFTTAGDYEIVYNNAKNDYINSGLTEGSDGNLYFDDSLASGTYAIVAFNIAHKSILFTIPLQGNSQSGLAPDNAGNLYGVTSSGGSDGLGTIYKLTFTGSNPQVAPTLSTVYNFTGGDDGGEPESAPVLASDGFLYGTTNDGCGSDGDGGVWQFSLSTSKVKRLACFMSGTPFYSPDSPLVEASDHNLYGIADHSTDGSDDGGVYSVNLSSGAISEIYESGNESLYNFIGGAPYTDNNGNLLITSYDGNGGGLLADVTISGSEQDLHTFSSTDAAGEYLPLTPTFGSDGNIYGTTDTGTSHNNGSLYEIAAGATPMISLTTSATTVDAGQPFMISWSVLNAFSLSAQACYATSDDYSFSGALSTSGSMTLTPANPGTHTYGYTCGGVESATATVNVEAGQIAVSDSGGNPVSSYNFGAVPEDTSATAYTITVTNNGYAPFPLALAKTGSTSDLFGYTDTCGGSIAAHSNCNISFYYDAPADSENDSAAFQIEPHGFTFSPGSSTFYLYAHSSTPGVISLSADDHSFGSVDIGSNNSYTFTVYNGTGTTQAFSLGGTVVAGGTSQGATSTTCASTLAVNAECTVTYLYTPMTPGTYEYDLKVITPATEKPASIVKLTATAT